MNNIVKALYIAIVLILITLTTKTNAFGQTVTLDSLRPEPGQILATVSDQVIDNTRDTTLKLYENIANNYRGIYAILSTICLSILIYLYIVNKIGLDTIITFLIALCISATVVLNINIFTTLIYDPFFYLLYGFCGLLAETAAGKSSGIGDIEKVSDLIIVMSRSVEGYSSLLNKFREGLDFNFSNIITAVELAIAFIILKTLFSILLAFFVIKITFAVFACNMMMVLMPITLTLFPFKNYRAYAYNNIKQVLYYALVILFSCIAVAVVINITNTVISSIQIKDDELVAELGFTFYITSLTTALLGFIFLFSANELASRMLNTVGGGAMSSLVQKLSALTLATAVATKSLGARSIMKSLQGGSKLGSGVGKGIYGAGKGASNVASLSASWIKDHMNASKHQQQKNARLGLDTHKETKNDK